MTNHVMLNNIQHKNLRVITRQGAEFGDNIGTVPTGLGLSARLSKEFLIDVRGTYRFAFNDTLLDTASADVGGGTARLDTWNVAGRLGFEF
jgi:hypothetical protein